MSVALSTASALKLTLGLCHVLSATGVYAVTRSCGRRRAASFVAGLAYVLCFWHTQQVLIMGRLPLALVYALLPWVLYGFERLCRAAGGARLRWALLGGCALGLVILTHPGYGYWSCAFAALYMALRLGLAPGRVWRRHRVPLGVVLLGTGVVIGACLVLPMWADRHATGLGAGFSLQDVPDPRWWSLLVWSNFRFLLIPPDAADYNWYGGYLGLSLVGIALAGATLLGHRRFGRVALPTLLCLAATTVIALGHSSPWVQWIPGTGLLSGGRYLLFATLFLSLAVGHGAHALQVALRRRSHRVVPLLLIAIVADLGPTTFQQPFGALAGRDSTGFPLGGYDRVRAAVQAAPADELPGFRAVLVGGDLGRYSAIGLTYAYGGIPNPDGPHPGELAGVFELVQPLQQYLVWKVNQDGHGSGRIDDPAIAAGLALLNVRFLLVGSISDAGRTLSDAEVPYSTPILVSGAAAPFSELLAAEPDIARLIDTQDSERVARITRTLALVRGMGIDAARRTCRTIYLRDLGVRCDLGTDPRVTVVRHTVHDQRVELEVEISAACFARLAYAFYPHTDVLVDGREVQALETEDRFTGLQLEPGTHLIVLQPRFGLLRQTLAIVSLAVLSATAVLFYRSRGDDADPA